MMVEWWADYLVQQTVGLKVENLVEYLVASKDLMTVLKAVAWMEYHSENYLVLCLAVELVEN